MEDAELCLGLGLPGGNKTGSGGKRGFTETESAPPPLDLKLKLQTTNQGPEKPKRGPVREEKNSSETTARPPASKAQVVGWPPVRSYRKNVLISNSEKGKVEDEKSAAFVKVSMDGAPYLRKVDLKMYNGYKELSKALDKMFGSFNTEFVITYEDKDGDWMLVGDLPFEMFVDSCKRLRVMKGSDAMELAPRGTEKRKTEDNKV